MRSRFNGQACASAARIFHRCWRVTTGSLPCDSSHSLSSDPETCSSRLSCGYMCINSHEYMISCLDPCDAPWRSLRQVLDPGAVSRDAGANVLSQVARRSVLRRYPVVTITKLCYDGPSSPSMSNQEKLTVPPITTRRNPANVRSKRAGEERYTQLCDVTRSCRP